MNKKLCVVFCFILFIGLVSCSNPSIMPFPRLLSSPERISGKAGQVIRAVITFEDVDNLTGNADLTLSEIKYTENVSVSFQDQTINRQKSVQVEISIAQNTAPSWYSIGIRLNSADYKAQGLIGVTVVP